MLALLVPIPKTNTNQCDVSDVTPNVYNPHMLVIALVRKIKTLNYKCKQQICLIINYAINPTLHILNLGTGCRLGWHDSANLLGSSTTANTHSLLSLLWLAKTTYFKQMWKKGLPKVHLLVFYKLQSSH